MRLRSLRPPVLLLAAIVLASPATGGAASTDVTTDRGIVQSVSTSEITLRGLDGSVIALAVGRATRVRVNGRPALLADVRPGFVAAVVHNGSAPARAVRAFGRITRVTERGIVTALSPRAITLRTRDGSMLTVALDASTRFRRFGVPVKRAAARPGALVAVIHQAGGTARQVTVLRRP